MKRTSLLLFLAVFAALLLFAPYSIRSMGYASEEIDATRAFLSPHTVFRGGLELPAMRHGLVPVIMEMPFLLPLRIFGIENPTTIDVVASLQPVLFTALIALLVFLWSTRSGVPGKRATLLAFVSVFATMLWPYAYIGLETTQSLLVLLLAFVALKAVPKPTWSSFLLFTILAALTASAKSTGLFILPAVAYLCFMYVSRVEEGSPELRPQRIARLLILAVVVLGFFAVNYHIETMYWKPLGGREHFFQAMVLHDPISMMINAWSFFGSPNKSLFWFAPLTVLGIAAMPKALRNRSSLAIFVLLLLLGLVGGFSLIRAWSDETWGPRYLHVTVAPLLLLWIEREAELPVRKWITVPLVVIGLLVSLLGSLFYYGSLHRIQVVTGQATLEALQHDPVWNHIEFNARLLGVEAGVLSPRWSPFHKWLTYGPPPPDFRGWGEVDLAPFATPQPLILRKFR